MYWLKHLREPKLWLLGIVAAVIALHLTLVNRAGDSESFATCMLFWLVAGSLTWDKRQTLVLESGIFSSFFGATLLALIFLKSYSLQESSSFFNIFPLVSVVGMCLLASGFKQLRQYWKELLVFGLLAVSPLLQIMLQFIDLPHLTAKASTFMLWYSGFQIQRQGVFLIMPTGRVEVYGACSGIHTILQMLNISVLFLVTVTVRPAQRVLCIVVALLLGFIVNSARVSLMAILVAFSHQNSFEYWHSGDGSLIFSAISVLLFGGFCWLAFLRNPPKKSTTGAEADV